MVQSPSPRRRRSGFSRSLALLSAAVGATLASKASAASGTWTNAAGGNWELATPGNWSGGTVADGADSTADFSTIDITADRTVVLTEARTIGNLTFGDTATATAGSWTLNDGGVGANVLTLSTTAGTPQITVNTLGAAKNVTLAMGIAGTAGLLKSGIGQLILSSTNNTYTGATSVNRGTLTWANSGSLANVSAGSVLVNVAGAVNYTPGDSDATFLSKINTASTGALAITSVDAATNFNFTAGTLGTLGSMSIGAVLNNTVTYTGTITPAASTYRIGGGGGTLQVNSVLAAGNSLVVGNGANANGTVILANSTNTYDGTTTIANGMTLQVGLGTGFASFSAAAVANDGTFVIQRTGTFTDSHTYTGAGSYNKRGNGGSETFNGSFTGGAFNVDHALVTSAPVLLDVNGGTINSNALSTIQGATSSQTAVTFQLTSGNVTFSGGIRSDNSDTKATIKILGGNFVASDVNIMRNAGSTPDFTSGFIVAGGTATIGTATIGSNNSYGNMSVEGGALTATGSITLGNQATAGRGGALRVTSGSLVAPEIVLGKTNGAVTNNVGTAAFSGGTSTVDKFTIGFDGTVTGTSSITVSGTGVLYVGTGGIVKNATGTSSVNLTNGLLGAKADWSTSHNLNLNGGNFTLKAADVSDVAHNMNFSGVMSGTGSFTKTGGGSLTLLGANTYSGTTTVSAGSLIGNTNSIRGVITNNGNVTFDQASAGSFAGAMSGTGSLSKSSAGTLVLTSAQSYTGAASVTGGVLRLSGTQATSGIAIGNTAGLAVNSGVLTVNALSFGSGGGDAMTLGVNDGTGIKTITVNNTNGLSTAGATTVDVGSTGLTVGTYVLIDYAGSIQGSGYGGFTLGALPPRVIASLVNNTSNTSVDLAFTGIDFPRWEGTAANPTFWDVNTTTNWKEATSNNPTNYLESTTPHDQVLFTDAATGTTTVDVTTTVTPSGVTINNGTKNYTFVGSGKISGSTYLTKMGTGTATLSNSGVNDYTGDTTLSAGTLVLGADNVLSDNSLIAVSGGTLDINSRSDVTGPLILNSGLITGTSGSLSSTSYDVRSGTVNATLSGAGPLTKTTAGTVALNTPASYSGNTTIADGTLQLGATNALPVATNLIIGQNITSGTLEMNGFSQQVDRLSSAGTGTANTITNSVGGPAAVLKIAGITSDTTYAGALNGNIALLMDSTRTLTLANSANTYTGGTTIDNLGILVFNGDGALGAVPGVSTQNIIFNNVGGRLTAGANLGAFSLAATRDILIDFGLTATFDTGGNANTWTIPGVISGAGHLSKAGNGTLILTNSANSYGGNTSITAGNLRITSPTAISPNPITIGVGSLQLDNGVSISNGITSTSSSADNMIDSIAAGGTATYAGIVSFATGAQLRMAATGTGATLIFSGSASSGNSFVANQGNITMVGSSSISASQGLLARPAGAATLAFTLKDSSTFSATAFTNLGNARNVSDVTLTLQDSATYSTGTTFTLLDTTNATGTSTVNLNGASILTSGNFLKTSNGATQSSTINFNGGTLKVAGTSNTYMPALTNLTVNVNANATIDTNTFDATIAQPFTGAGTGGLIKNGSGTLTMSGVNTWAGNTTINAGKLVFANSLTTSSSVSVNNDAVLEIAPTGTGTRVIKTGPITIASLARINVQDNKLITTSPAGTWNGSNYTDITGAIATGRGTGNLWDGATGILTTQTAAVGSNYTSIGVARASDVRPATATATALWAGQTITGTDTLVMYTYGGDATLDGKINIDDYVKIDSGIAASLTGWSNGDFNYDGKINIDDYTTVIDANIGNQNGVFFTSGGLGGGLDGGGPSGVTAVPEPATVGGTFVMALGTALLRRSRRRR